MAHYLVTGGAGFIGSHIAERLLGEGHQVRVLDNLATGRESNLTELADAAGEGRLEIHRSDLRNPDHVKAAVEGVEGVFHQAALGSVPRSISHPLDAHETNITGTLSLLVAAKDAGVRRFLFAGSSSVYGSLESLPKREEHPTLPISPYGVTKLTAEEYLRVFRELFSMETVTLRYYNVFGPRQDPGSQYAAVIPKFIQSLVNGEAPLVDGDGEQSRDFTYVSNVVDANLLAMNAPSEAVSPGLFNVAAGGRHSVNELVKELKRLLGASVDAVHGDPRPGDVRHSQADISRIQSRLGYEASVSFAEGLERTVEYFKARGNQA